MPRLLPRLIKEIKKQTGQAQHFAFQKPNKKQRKSLYKPSLSPPSFHPSHYESSILLSDQNPVANATAYVKHKRLPPTLHCPRQSDKTAADPPRQMTNKELAWWANPYLRILASPLRTCVVTNRTIPTDLLIRLVGMRLPPSFVDPLSKKTQTSMAATLVPDGVLHPKYASRKVGGSAAYVLCWRKAIEGLHPGSHRRIAGKLVFPPNFSDYVAHLLRLRVLQELELLTERLECAMHSGKNLGNPAVILRRLSRDEWIQIKSTAAIPYPSAIAVLVVPQPNRDPLTKERPLPSMSAYPPEDEERPEGLPPLSELLPRSGVSITEESGALPRVEIPLYNSITAFPSRSQRAALYQFLTRILAAERFLKRLHNKNTNKHEGKEENSLIGKGSHAFLLCSDERTTQRGDSAAVAQALWRLRIYEGKGWIPAN